MEADRHQEVKNESPEKILFKSIKTNGFTPPFGHCRTHVVSHDLGDTLLQEVLSRSQATEIVPTLDKIFIFNGGLFLDLHRPILMQRILLSPVLGYLATFFVSKGLVEHSF